MYDAQWNLAPGRTSPRVWRPLGPAIYYELMCLHNNSPVVRSIMEILYEEVMRGGVSLVPTAAAAAASREGKEKLQRRQQQQQQQQQQPPPIAGLQEGTRDPRDEARLRSTLMYALLYGHLLYGLIPYMIDPDRSGSVWIPPPDKGYFVVRGGNYGKVDIRWRWLQGGSNGRQSGSVATVAAAPFMGLQGQSYEPDPKVGVYVWKRRWPYDGASAPFNSKMQLLLTDLVRYRTMLENDAQADWERTHGTLVVEPAPRKVDPKQQSRHVVEVLFRQFVCDPSGRRPGNAPGGGMLSRGQVRRESSRTTSNLMAMATSTANANYGAPDDAIQTRVDPCTGMLSRKRRTVAWQRAVMALPDDVRATNAFPQPQLRPDLLAQSNHWITTAAMTIGIPPAFVYGAGYMSQTPRASKHATGGTGSVAGGAQSSSSAAGSPGGGGGLGLGPGSPPDQMRGLVGSLRTELEAFAGEAFTMAAKPGVVADLSRKVQRLDETDLSAMTFMERQLQLMGDTLAQAVERLVGARQEDTKVLDRAVAVADRAQELWKADFVRAQVALIRGSLEELTHPTGRQLEEQRIRGMDAEPLRYPGQVLAPSDDGNLLDPPTTTREPGEGGKNKKVVVIQDNPNALAELASKRRDRILEETDGLFGGTRMVLPATSGLGARAQRVALPEIPDLARAVERAERTVEEKDVRDVDRADAVQRMQRLRDDSRREPLFGLQWPGMPVPDWTRMESLVELEMMDPLVLQQTLLLDMGLSTADIHLQQQWMQVRQRERENERREDRILTRREREANIIAAKRPRPTAAAAAAAGTTTAKKQRTADAEAKAKAKTKGGT